MTVFRFKDFSAAFPSTTTRDLDEDHLTMYIFEIFTTEYPGPWQESGRFRLRSFEVDGITYVIQLEHKLLPGKVRGVEVSFFRPDIKAVDSSFSTTRDQRVSVQVYAHVFGVLRPFYRETGETLYLTAEPRHSAGTKELLKKSRIYHRSADELVKREGGMMYVARQHRATEFLVTKSVLPADHPYWVNERNEALLSAGLPPNE